MNPTESTNITIAPEDLLHVAQAVVAYHDTVRSLVRCKRQIATLTGTTHSGALTREIKLSARLAHKRDDQAHWLRGVGIDPATVVADIDQTVPADIQCTCHWCSEEVTA